jgi:hypothetical protein
MNNFGEGAFAYCTSLRAITVAPQNTFYSSSNGVLFNQSQTALVEYPDGLVGSYTIPNGVTSIGYGAFSETSLTSVTIPGSVTNIGYYAFYGCTNLTTVTISNGVTSIGGSAFDYCPSLTDVTIPASVTNIGRTAFAYCTSLTAITVAAQNAFYSSINGVLFNHSQTTLVEYPGGGAGSYTIPNGVTSIGDYAFYGCPGLTSVTIPSSVTSIGLESFFDCANLTSLYFTGNAPAVGGVEFSNVPTVYYLLGTTGWTSTFADTPTKLWKSPIQASDATVGVRSNQFGFNITGSVSNPVVVEASTNLASTVWSPIQTNTLTGGTSYFSDPQWTNYPRRFYRIRSP